MIKQIQYQYISKLTLLVTRLLKYAESLLPVEQPPTDPDSLEDDFITDSEPTRPELDIHKIENDFMSEMNLLFSKLTPTGGKRSLSSDLNLADLTLLEDEELKENLVLDAMVAKANIKTEMQIKQLSQRLASVLVNNEIKKELNPFYPRNICKSFQKAIQKTDLTSMQRIYLFERFDSVVLFELNDIFKNINEQMKSAGILADLSDKPKIIQTKTTERPRFDDNHARIDTHEEDEGDLLGALQGLMRRAVPENQSAAPIATNSQNTNVSAAGINPSSVVSNQSSAVTNLPTQAVSGSTISPQQAIVEVNQETLLTALDNVQNMQQDVLTFKQAQRQVGKVKKELSTSIQSANPNVQQFIGNDNESLIDIVSMIFEFIFDDYNLPDEFKALLGRLQIPIIKVAIIDPTFINMGQHPARRLVNQMAHACVGWTEDQGTGLKDKITEIINRVTNEFQDDTKLFDELLDEFIEFADTHNHRVSLIEKRLKEAEEGKALQEQAMKQASSAISRIKSGHMLPDTIERFLDEDWYNLMTLAFLREGRSSMMWQQYLDTGKALVKSLYPIRSRSDRAIHKLKSADLISDLKKGLDVLGLDDFETRGVITDLTKLHDNVRDGQQIITPTTSDDAESPQTENEMTGEAEPVDHEIMADLNLGDVEEIEITELAESSAENQELEEYYNQVSSLQSGIWFNKHDGTRETRCKLAAVITTVGKYIFVNNAGRKVAEFTKNELAVALRDKILVQLEDGALFERALKNIVTNFKTRQYESDKEWSA